MIEAIVYTSNTGFTKKYADLLSENIGLPVYRLEDSQVVKGKSVIYMGWLKAGVISGYQKAKKMFNLAAVCAVGMALPSENYYSELSKKYSEEKLFYLQGGFDMEKLHGIYKFMMKTMERALKPKLESKEEKTPEDEAMLYMITNGADCVNKDNLKYIIEWYKSC